MRTLDLGLEYASGKMDDALLKEMHGEGVALKRFHKPYRFELVRLNNCKLLVVDGTAGFSAGVGIAHKWMGAAQDLALA